MLAELNADEEDLVEFTTELVTTCCGCAVEVTILLRDGLDLRLGRDSRVFVN